MRIAIFTDAFYPSLGGMEDATADLARALGSRGHEVTVFAPAFSRRDFLRRGLPKQELDLGERVKIKRLFSVPVPGNVPGGRAIVPLGAGYNFLKKESFDIIHTQSIFGAGLEAFLASSLLKIRLVGTNHSILSEFVVYSPVAKNLLSKMAAYYEAWFYNRCSFLSTASRAVFLALSQAGFQKTHQVVSNIVDIRNFQPANQFPADSFTLVYAGRFALEKRGEILFRAMSLVKEKLPQAELLLAGAGPEEENWKKIIKELNLEDNIKFVGKLTKPQLAQLLQKAKAFIIASAIENQSLVTLQSMACGLPIVGVDGRGMPEYVKDGQNGFIVPVDDYSRMAERIIELLINPELALRLGRNGREMVESFTADIIAEQWEKIYNQVITDYQNKKQI